LGYKVDLGRQRETKFMPRPRMNKRQKFRIFRL